MALCASISVCNQAGLFLVSPVKALVLFCVIMQVHMCLRTQSLSTAVCGHINSITLVFEHVAIVCACKCINSIPTSPHVVLYVYSMMSKSLSITSCF